MLIDVSDGGVRMMSSCRMATLAGLYLCLVAGCGSRTERVKVHPVRGKVIFSAPAAANAMVVFHPIGTAKDPKVPRPFAQIEKDGSFEVSTYNSKDGAPEGRYAVTLLWELPAKGSDDDTGPDLLRNTVYSDPARTPFQVTVKPGRNELEPFVIQKK